MMDWRHNPHVAWLRNHSSMQAYSRPSSALGNGRPLEADQRREPARLVELVRRLGDVVPHLAVDRRAWAVLLEELLGNEASGEALDQIEQFRAME